MTLEPLTGPSLSAAIDDLARLRIAVFAAFPYLYDGDPTYEARYLAEFAAEADSLLVAARDGSRIVGAATVSPLSGQPEDFRAPFAAHGIDPANTAYFGESVLLPEYRGQGIGHAFFNAREAHARAIGAQAACFAAVIRPADHPARPAGYRPLDGFWEGRGYRPVSGLTVTIGWREHGEAAQSDKTLQVWHRRL